MELFVRSDKTYLETIVKSKRDPSVWCRTQAFSILNTGRFEIANIPPGRWSVLAYGKVRGQSIPMTPLARLDVADGQEVDIELDTAKLRPARIEGKLLVGTTPLSGAVVVARGWMPGQTYSSTSARTRTQETGLFRFENLAPINWRLYVVLVDQNGRGGGSKKQIFLPLANDLTLQPAQKLVRNFKFVTRSLSVRLLSPDGKTPLAQRCLEFERDEVADPADPLRVLARRFTDADGLATLGHAPLRRLRVFTYPTDWELRELEVQAAKHCKHRVFVGIVDPRRLADGQPLSLRLPPEH